MKLKRRPGGTSKPRPKFKQKGVTLFELLLVLFVAAFVAVAVATIYNRVNTTYKENVLFNDTQQLAANIRAIYGSSPDFSTLTNDVIMNSGIAPDSMLSSDGTLRITPFFNSNDTWSVASANGGEEFTITIDNLPSSVCTGMAGKGLGVANSVSTGGNNATTNMATLAEGCAGGDATVALTYN